jgi:alanine racemase
MVKSAPAGAGVSYGHTYTTPADTTLAVVPPRATPTDPPTRPVVPGPIQLRGRVYPVAGRVCMDQVVIDLADSANRTGVCPGDVRREVFGDGPGRAAPPLTTGAVAR